MLSPALQDALNAHFTHEHAAALSYLAMASFFEDRNLPGFASWMRAQAEDELAHAMRFFDFIHQKGGRVRVSAIPEPRQNWESPLEVFRHAHEQECEVTKRIHGLVDLALSESDHATNAFLQWFVTEQVEEENTASEICHKFELIEDNPVGLLALDRELGSRAPAGGAH